MREKLAYDDMRRSIVPLLNRICPSFVEPSGLLVMFKLQLLIG